MGSKKMRRPKGPHGPKFTTVTVRLLTEDVAAIKAEAARADEIGWQPRLRKLVHDAVRAQGVVK